MATKSSAKTKTTSKAPVVSKAAHKTSRVSAAKKVAPRSSTSRSRKAKEHMEESVDVRPVVMDSSPASKKRFHKSSLIAGIAAVVIILLAYSLRGLFVAAWVNGQPIWRLSVIHSLEQQGGSQVLQSLETNALIQQAAEKKHITVSQKDIDNQIKQIEKNLSAQGQTLDAALAYQHMTKSQLVDEIKMKLTEDKLVGTPVITDKQAQDYMDKNKDSLPAGTSLAQVKQQLSQQQLQQKEQQLVSDLQSKAKIISWVSY